MKSLDDRRAAAAAAAREVKTGMVIGLGSGRTVAHVVKEVAKRGIDVACVCSSAQITEVVVKHGMKIIPLESVERVDLVIDGADEVDTALRMLKGGGGALARERVIHALGPVIVAIEGEKLTNKIGTRAPVVVEVLPPARRVVAKLLQNIGLVPILRVDSRGFPIFTENGNVLFDAKVPPNWNPEETYYVVKTMPGVVEVGIFLKEADKIYVASGGEIKVLTRKH